MIKKALGIIYVSLVMVSVVSADEEVEEIVVSANGIPTPIEKVGASVDVITADELHEQQTVYLQDALKLKGINVPQNGGTGTLSNVFLRGLPGKYTTLEVDGISLSDPGTPSGEVAWQDVFTDNVERVEILRGAHSVLYGSSAIGGVISQYTATGGEPQTGVRVEYGAFDTRSLVLTQKGGNERAAVGFAIGNTSTDGISAWRTSEGRGERDGYESFRFNGRADFFLGDFVTLEFAARYATGEGEYDPYNDRTFSIEDSDGVGQAFTRSAGRVGLSYHTDAVRLTLDVTQYESETHQIADFDTASEIYIARDYASRQKAGLRGSFNFGGGVQLVVGGETIDEETDPDLVLDFTGTTLIPTNIDHAEMQAAYMLWQAAMRDVTLTLAVRRDDHEFFDTHDTQRVTLAYQPIDALTLRAAYGTGFKAPTLYQVFRLVDAFNRSFGNDELQPELARSGEIGLNLTFGQSWHFATTIFEAEIHDLIRYLGFQMGYRQSDDTLETQGAELSIGGDFVDGLSFGFSAVYTDAYSVSKNAYSVPRETRNRSVRVPRLQGEFSLDYQIGLRVSLGLDARHVRGVLDFGARDIVELDDYTLLGLRGRYTFFEGTEIYARVENAADEDYETVSGYGTPGRAAYIGLTTRF